MTALYSWMDDELYMGSYQLTVGWFSMEYVNDWLNGLIVGWMVG